MTKQKDFAWEDLEDAIAKVATELIGRPKKCTTESIATVDEWNDNYITIVLFPADKEYSELQLFSSSRD